MDEALHEHLKSRLGDFDCFEVEQGVNDVYILTLEDRELVLKVQSDRDVDRSTEAEPEVYRVIGEETDIPSPHIVHKDFSRENVEKAFYVMEKMMGKKAEQVWPEMSMVERKEVVRRYGEILGEIHNLRSFSGYGALRFRDGRIRVENGEGSWRKALAGKFDEWGSSLEKWKNPPDVEVPEKDELADIIPENPEPVLVHEDNRLDNLILQGSEIAGFLDWSDPASGSAKYDVARAEYLIIDGDTTYAGQEVMTDGEKAELRKELIEGYRKTNSIDSGWMKSEERKIYRYAAILNISADFKEWSKHIDQEKRREIREELIDRLKTEEPKDLLN